ncbi:MULTISPECIES: TniB family NTP-binding protein [Sphingomonadaceae]|jgi:replication-associated recombination protein RarA|uniref:TniB family NTP-binding protein n=1 Tax=Sphingomonadales TaxID=204457 RepID=UPI0006FD998F|nr:MULTISPECIES: TniB family NTP-binding protein [Sphingomonadaceae]KQX24186.1 transposase [Sphingomonas sp. Root1294]KQY69641.1 transposase [Sphingomonas sp. Root50]KRB92989.1 transposase [Sphingomonas sp. Root720]HUD95455.1 TniB family NTP-binding protein [Sphingobium sp.]
MTDLYDHLFPAYRDTASMPDDERIDWLRRDRWMALPQAGEALRRLEDVLTYPQRGRMPCLLLFGTTGMGKSEIVNRFAELHASSYDQRAGLTTMPVVVVQMPPQPSEEEFYTELLLAMNLTEFEHMSLRSLRSLSRRMLAELGVRVLVLDEIDKMLAGSPRQQRIFLNTIRFLTNDLKIPIVCAGTEDARIAVLTDPNLADRFAAFELVPWRNDQAFRQLMASFSGLLPLRLPSQLDANDVRQRVLNLSQGVTGRIFRLMEALAIAAIRNKREMIDASSFDDEALLLPLVSMQVIANTNRTLRRRVA